MKKQADHELVAIIQARITARIKALGITQAQLAEKADVSKSGLNEVIKKNRVPGSDFLLKIATVLGVSVDFLLGKGLDSDVEKLLGDERMIGMIKAFAELSTEDQVRVLEVIDTFRNSAKPEP